MKDMTELTTELMELLEKVDMLGIKLTVMKKDLEHLGDILDALIDEMETDSNGKRD